MSKVATIGTNVVELFQPEGTSEPSGLGCLVIIARHHGLDLSVSQLVHDNYLVDQEVSVPELLKAARSAGLRAQTVRLDWYGLNQLDKALPAIVRLNNGRSMVLLRLEGGESEPSRVVLQDPNAGDDALLMVDRVRFENAWTGEVILVRRDYDVREEFAAVFDRVRPRTDPARAPHGARHRHMRGRARLSVSDADRLLASTDLARALLQGLQHILRRLRGDARAGLFEAAFFYIRRFLIIHLASRLDLKLNIYLFDKLVGLPIDFFERHEIGKIMTVYNFTIRSSVFSPVSCWDRCSTSSLLLFFVPVMFYLSPLVTTVVLSIAGIIVAWLVITLPIYRRKNLGLEAIHAERGSFLYQTLAGIRTVKSLNLEARQRQRFDVLTAKVAKGRIELELFGAVITTVARPLEMLAIAGGLALAVYICITTDDPTLTAALFAYLLLSQRVVQPLLHMAQSISQWDDARVAIQQIGELVNRPQEDGRDRRGARLPVHGGIQFHNVTFTYQGASSPALKDVSFEVPPGTTLGLVGRSGSGKTTVTRLLQRFHPNYEGLIKVDGVDLREYAISELRH